jgi:glycosyltransferase involved in cell wall biosynthesis
MARNPKNKPLRRLYYHIQMRKMRRFEAQILPHFHQCYVVAPADRAALLTANPKIQVSVIRIGIRVPSTFETVQHDAEQSPTLVISGSMDADLNVQAVLFFYQHVLPLIRQQISNVKLIIVGSNPVERIRRLAKNDPNVLVTGYVESIWPYIDQADVYVCPLLSASGAQTRMLEAMALGKAIVSTSFAANPLSLKSGEQVLVADDAEELAAHVILLLRNPDIRNRLGAAARQAVALYKWETIIGQVYQLYQRAIDTARLNN